MEPTEKSENRTADRLARAVVVYVVAVLLTLPLFVILNAYVPELYLPIGERDPLRVDHLLTFVLVLFGFVILVQRFRVVVFTALIGGLVVLTLTSLFGAYSFGDLYTSYAGLLRDLRTTSAQIPMAADRADPFRDADKLRDLVRQEDPAVRRSAVLMATVHFSKAPKGADEHTLVQSFSIFKEINSRWTYVSDVKGGEYFAPPTESLELMAGDCDDHAVLMAAMITSVGGQVRLIRTEGHVYPELLIGTDAQLERAAYLIRKVLFTREVGDAPLYHHTDADGRHWINLDYTRPYPGGELMNERIVGILQL